MKNTGSKSIGLASAVVLALSLASNANAGDDDCFEFSDLSMVLEQNATDDDTEVVLFAKGQDDGLGRLTVWGPDMRKVASFKGDKKGIGIRELALESAEPPELDKVLAFFPEGEYLFEGRTVEGDCLFGSTFLSHAIAPETVILSPVEDAIIAPDMVTVTWTPVPEAVVYLIELKNEDTENALLVEVPAPNTAFEAPASWLVPGTEYQVAVGVKTESGNVTNVESAFFTDLE